MATPKRSMKNKSTKDFAKEKKQFDFGEYNNVKLTFNTIEEIYNTLTEAKEDITNNYNVNTITDIDLLAQGIEVMMESFKQLEATDIQSEKKSILTLYREIFKKLFDLLSSLTNDYSNRYSIVKSKLNDLEQERKAYIEKELQAMKTNTTPGWINNSSLSMEQLMTIIGAALGGLGIQLPNGKVLIFDQNGCRFR